MVWPAPCAGAVRGVLACGLGLALGACGRVGLELLPSDGGLPDVDPGPSRDAAPIDVDPACETRCENAHGSADCSSGRCELTCTAGYADCDADPGNGCEANLRSSVASCGACGQSCENPGGTAACLAGRCAPVCTPNAGDCDGNLQNGCETDLRRPESCGACDTVCENRNGSIACGSATCAPVCRPGYGDCDGDPQNGCEADLGGAATCPVACDLAGVFALKLAFPSSWPSSRLISSGSGTFVFWARVQLSGGPTALRGTLVPCGQTVPDFASSPLIGERYGVSYPAALFERTTLTATATSVALDGTYPGAGFALARSALLYGASLSDPVDGAFPNANQVVSADADLDGKRGLTALYKSGPGYTDPPVNNLGLGRAEAVYLASRVVFELSGGLTSCSLSQGTATTRGLDARTLGCRLAGGNGRDCNAAEADHLDENAPRFALGTGTYLMRRVADGASCADVQRAVP